MKEQKKIFLSTDLLFSTFLTRNGRESRHLHIHSPSSGSLIGSSTSSFLSSSHISSFASPFLMLPPQLSLLLLQFSRSRNFPSASYHLPSLVLSHKIFIIIFFPLICTPAPVSFNYFPFFLLLSLFKWEKQSENEEMKQMMIQMMGIERKKMLLDMERCDNEMYRANVECEDEVHDLKRFFKSFYEMSFFSPLISPVIPLITLLIQFIKLWNLKWESITWKETWSSLVRSQVKGSRLDSNTQTSNLEVPSTVQVPFNFPYYATSLLLFSHHVILVRITTS